MKTIPKKILPRYFEAVDRGEKTFELRKDEDDIQPGDVLELQEWNGVKYTGRTATFRVGFVLRDGAAYGLMDGFCAISLLPKKMEGVSDGQ